MWVCAGGKASRCQWVYYKVDTFHQRKGLFLFLFFWIHFHNMTKNKNKYMNKKPRVFLHYYIICFKLYVKNFFLNVALVA